MSLLHCAQAQSVRTKDSVAIVAYPLPLSSVRLTGGPLKHAQDLDAKYLLELEPDRMLAYYRIQAGLEPKAKPYDGWDGGGKSLAGHIAGHYLSAVSQMYAATGDARFKERADYIVAQFKEVQAKNGDGSLIALEGGREKFAEVSRGDIRSGGFDLNGLWSPWYVLHKTYAGLRDAYRYLGNKDALDVEVKFSEWAEKIMAPLDEAQTQKMLNTEFGGMDEVFADLYADTGDARWLALSRRFIHKAVMSPLENKQDKLGGLHANTQVPKAIGALSRYVVSGDQADGTSSRFFWDTVVKNHSFATGGHGKDEYFGPAGELSARVDGRTDESCNVYNMLKMTRTLFSLAPQERYAAFQERALFNHVLGSIDPKDGRTCYMVPIGRGVQHEYQDMQHSFTCCVGSGMESHALHGDGIYYEAKDRLWVNIYTPSTAQWKSQNATLSMATSFPEGDSASLKITLAAPKYLTLSLRRPAWAQAGFAVSVNGKALSNLPAPGSYVDIKRQWKSGDVIALKLPKYLHAEPLPDNAARVALMWGPLVLAGDMGPEGKPVSTPVFVARDKPVAQWLKPVAGKAGAFVGVGQDIEKVGQQKPVDFVPFYRLHERTYSATFDLYTPAEWQQKSVQIAAEQEKQRRLEAATVAYVRVGEMQPERDFNQAGEESEPAQVMGRAGRRGRKWFSFEMPVEAARSMTLVVTYNSEEWRTRTFDILIDGQKLASQKVERDLPGRFYDVETPIPAALVAGKTKVTVRFEATNNNEIAAIFGIRMVRADAMNAPANAQAPAVAPVALPVALSAPMPAITRIEPAEAGFFSKQLKYYGIPIKAHEVVSDEALAEAYRRLDSELGKLPDVRDNLALAKAELHIIGKDQVTSDLPAHRDMKGKKIPEYGGLTVDERTRGLGGIPTSCGEENLLKLPGDRYKGRDICVHEFAHCIQDYGVSDDVRAKIRDQYNASLAKGLWKGSYAASNEHEFFAELTMWYLGTHGDMNMTGVKPADGPEGLRAYDPDAFKLMDDFYSGRIPTQKGSVARYRDK
jgi:DUF1680 family protein